MALIKCSECGKEVSDKAISCVNCGAPILGNLNTNSSVSTKFTSYEEYKAALASQENENTERKLSVLGKIWLIYLIAAYGISTIIALLSPILKMNAFNLRLVTGLFIANINVNLIFEALLCLSCLLLYKTLNKKHLYIFIVLNLVKAFIPLLNGVMLFGAIRNLFSAAITVLLTYLAVKNSLNKKKSDINITKYIIVLVLTAAINFAFSFFF